MELFEEIVLENGLTLEIWDDSRKIAEDTAKVSLTARIRVAVKEEYFPEREHYRAVLKVFGPQVIFEQKKERPFVHANEKDDMVNQLVREFKDATLKYISRPDFASGFVRSKFIDIQQNPYKYRDAEGKPKLTVIK